MPFDAYLPWLALGVSLLSLVISVFSLGWNYYRDVIFKPRLRLDFRIMNMFPDEAEHLVLRVTNLNTGEVTCKGFGIGYHGTFIRRLIRRPSAFLVKLDSNVPGCSSNPCKIAMSDELVWYYHYGKDCFLKQSPYRFGISDSFGRMHWIGKKQLRLAQKHYNERFRDKV